jgi:transcriptional regulator with XRE-family HTH domain
LTHTATGNPRGHRTGNPGHSHRTPWGLAKFKADLRAALKLSGLSQKEAAHRAGISYGKLRRWLSSGVSRTQGRSLVRLRLVLADAAHERERLAKLDPDLLRLFGGKKIEF